jgi:hypothetical protein
MHKAPLVSIPRTEYKEKKMEGRGREGGRESERERKRGRKEEKRGKKKGNCKVRDPKERWLRLQRKSQCEYCCCSRLKTLIAPSPWNR